MIWLLISAFFYAFNNLLWKFFVTNEPPLQLIARRAVFTTLIAFGALALAGGSLMTIATNPHIYMVLAGSVLGATGLIFMVSFLKRGSLGLLGYYSLLGVSINGFYTYIVRQLPISLSVIIGASILLFGFLLYLYHEGRSLRAEPVRLTQHLLLVCMTVFFTASTIVKWESFDHFSALELMFVQELVVLAVSIVVGWLFLRKTIPAELPKFSFWKYSVMAIVILLALYAGLLGLSVTNAFISSLAGIMVPVLTIIFGWLFLKERISITQTIAIVLIIIGELLLF